MHYLRAHMAPESLELLLFLYCNKQLWSYPRIIDEAICWDEDRKKKAAAEAQAVAVAAAADVDNTIHDADDDSEL